MLHVCSCHQLQVFPKRHPGPNADSPRGVTKNDAVPVQGCVSRADGNIFLHSLRDCLYGAYWTIHVFIYIDDLPQHLYRLPRTQYESPSAQSQ